MYYGYSIITDIHPVDTTYIVDCFTGSDFVAQVCKALAEKDAYAILEDLNTPTYVSAHEMVKVEYGNSTFTVSSGFNAMTSGYDEETANANKPDLSKLN